MNSASRTLALLLGLVLAAAFVVLASAAPSAEEQDAAQYCRMVWVHKRDSRYGWPDFRHVYAAQCHADGTLNEDYVNGR